VLLISKEKEEGIIIVFIPQLKVIQLQSMTMADVDQMLCDKYNTALEIKITKEIGQLDAKLNGYRLTNCIKEQCFLHKLMDYARGWYMYHHHMHKCIVVGCREPQHGHNKLCGDDM
jgi:hypothetical protein